MNNAVSRRIYENGDIRKQLAPVIPIKPAKKQKQKKANTVIAKAGGTEKVAAPAFSAPVFRPKKHDML